MQYKERRKIPIDQIIVPNVRVTSEFDEERIAYLESSIEEHGFIEPIKVSIAEDGKIYLIDGLHRMEALKRKGIKEIEADIFSATTDEILSANISTAISKGRANPVEVGNVVKHMVDSGKKIEDIAKLFGKNLRWAKLYLAIGTMDKKYQEGLARGKLSIGVIEKALELEDDNEINIALDYAMIYSYTIKEMEQYVKARKEELRQYEEWKKKFQGMEIQKPEATPELAYTTKCGICGEEVDSRFIRGAVICRGCLELFNLIYSNLGTPEKSFPILRDLITQYKERALYEELKKKFEKEEPKSPSQGTQNQSPPQI